MFPRSIAADETTVICTKQPWPAAVRAVGVVLAYAKSPKLNETHTCSTPMVPRMPWLMVTK